MCNDGADQLVAAVLGRRPDIVSPDPGRGWIVRIIHDAAVKIAAKKVCVMMHGDA